MIILLFFFSKIQNHNNTHLLLVSQKSVVRLLTDGTLYINGDACSDQDRKAFHLY